MRVLFSSTGATLMQDIYCDLMGAQVKTLSFLAYMVRFYADTVATHSVQLVQGVMGLFRLCPGQVAHLRKDLLIAARHILATDLKLSELRAPLLFIIRF